MPKIINKFDPMKKNMGLHIILESIGANHDLINQMKKNDDGTYDVTLTVGGVELDFNRFSEVVERQLSDLVEKKAQDLLSRKYSNLIDEISDIQERIEDQKEKFKYDWEE